MGFRGGIAGTAGARREGSCRRRVRRAPLVAAALGVLVPGPASASGSFTSTLHRAVERTLAAKSADVDMTLALSAGGHGRVQVLAVSGIQRFGVPVRASFTLRVDTGKTAQPTSIPEILYSTTVYLKVGGRWYSESFSQAAAQEGLQGRASEAASTNPTQALALLYQRGATVTRLGRRRLDGTTMTAYRCTVHLTKAAAKLPSGLTMTAQGLAAFRSLTGGAALSAEVWIDPAGALRQEAVTLPLSAAARSSLGLAGGPRRVSMELTVDVSDFGVPVQVAPPPSATPMPSAPGSAPS